jgi:alpha-tubulin suppressor-like RCC1 family protein
MFDHNLLCWGDGDEGELGLGKTADQTTPQQVSGKYWTSVSAGSEHSCATRVDHTLWCWGHLYAYGGGMPPRSPSDEDVLEPQRVPLPPWLSVSAGGFHRCGIRLDMGLWCWGENFDGQLGIGNYDSQATPAEVR